MKPDWKDAPEWAMWLARDSTGNRYWFERKPFTGEEMFFEPSYGGRVLQAVGLKWKEQALQYTQAEKELDMSEVTEVTEGADDETS